jgi:hypothetical protein
LYIAEIRNAYKIVKQNLQGKRPLGSYRHRQSENTLLKWMGYEILGYELD